MDQINEYKKTIIRQSSVLGSRIIPKSTVGSLINVNGVDISEKIFPEEYSMVLEAYYEVINKIDNNKWFEEEK